MNDAREWRMGFDQIDNFRDYGGWRAQGGARVATGRLFRSAHHARASTRDVERMKALDIGIVTDLRHPEEQREQPSAWIGTLVIRVIEEGSAPSDGPAEAPHVRAFRESDFTASAMRLFMMKHYGEMPYDARHVAMFRRYFDALATEECGLLIHCAAGKDRTGILAWLTHHVLGVHPDDALEDYLLSNSASNIAERMGPVRNAMERRYGRPIDDEAMLALLTVEPAYIDHCRAALESRSGSVDDYLSRTLGVDTAKSERIRERLLTWP